MDESETGRRGVTFPKSRGFRLLSPDERRRVLRRLRNRWSPADDKDWWHPYHAVNAETHVLHLKSSWLALGVPVAEFRRRAALRWSKFWVVAEGTPHFDDPRPSFQGEYEVSAAHINVNMSSETICVPRTLDWMVYSDHNDGTYLVGEWLVETVRDLWPAWERHVWTTPFYEHPPDSDDDPSWWD